MPLNKYIDEGGCLPRWYGFAYMDYERFAYVAYPIPINKLVGMWREFRYWLIQPFGGSLEKELQEAFCAGLNRGKSWINDSR